MRRFHTLNLLNVTLTLLSHNFLIHVVAATLYCYNIYDMMNNEMTKESSLEQLSLERLETLTLYVASSSIIKI